MRTKAVRDRMKNAGTQLCNVSMSAGFFQTQNNLIGISSCNAGPELTKMFMNLLFYPIFPMAYMLYKNFVGTYYATCYNLVSVIPTPPPNFPLNNLKTIIP